MSPPSHPPPSRHPRGALWDQAPPAQPSQPPLQPSTRPAPVHGRLAQNPFEAQQQRVDAMLQPQ
eukprot:14084777-Alexandrium_andersonii.AAC.1